jgi:excinuclease ABC subunit C
MNTSAGGFDAKTFVANLPRRPGVYRMYAADGAILYVGKAASLRDRVGSYFSAGNVQPKVRVLVALIARMEVTVTRSETEALILEYHLIKEHRPRFNVVMRDDKSFPWIWYSTRHDYPRLISYRGARNQPGRYFGPYPNAGAVAETLHYLQKIFRVRNCRDTYFANRSRPCLQHQIGRCSAPCVGLITREEYLRDVESAVKVLEGRDLEVNAQLAEAMDAAAARLDFERAAQLRDQLAALKEVQARQIVAAAGDRDVDVFALAGDATGYAVSVMVVRGGRSLGTFGFVPRAVAGEPAEVLSSFIVQHYAHGEPPPEILTDIELPDAAALAEALTEVAGRSVRLRRPQRGLGAEWTALVRDNAAQALRMERSRPLDYDALRTALAVELGLDAPPERLECFDISHTAGEGTVASCVVFGPDGPLKKDYRRFNVTGVAPGDDYGALRQALARRAERIRSGEVPMPDVLFIDGGPAQLAAVADAIDAAGLPRERVFGVSKGADRRPGQERLHRLGHDAASIPGPASPALRLVQQLRDEAHRFAIRGHRRRRARRFNESVLEAVPGLGPAKRRALLTHFGGLHGVLRAGVADLERVAGIGPALAQALYDQLHPGD